MQLIRQIPSLSDCATAVAIGNFDGLHLGHRAVIRAMKEAAGDRLLPSVLTFEPHPRRFFNKAIPNFRIERLRDKLQRLREAGVQRVYMPRFDQSFAQLSAEAFLDDVLGKQLGAKAVVTGENFAFGHQRRGDSAMLKAWGARNGVNIITLPPVMKNGEICSSSAIRALIAAGKVAHAGKLLGHPYRVSGRVVHGAKRGRTMGYPTANIALSPDLLNPAYGIYAVRAEVDGATFDGAASFGINPTVSVDNHATLEVYLFDTRQEIYGKNIAVSLVDKLRDEQKFETIDALKAQIAIDCEMARAVLARTP